MTPTPTPEQKAERRDEMSTMMSTTTKTRPTAGFTRGDVVLWRYIGRQSGEPKTTRAAVVYVGPVNIVIQVGSKGYQVKPTALEVVR